jgi:hypothetical protein
MPPDPGAVTEPDRLEYCVHPVFQGLAAKPVGPAPVTQVFHGGQIIVKRELLGHDPQVAARRLAICDNVMPGNGCVA